MNSHEEPTYEQFDTLVEHYGMLIRKLCWLHSSGSAAVCDELVHECYASIWSHLASLRPQSHQLQQSAWVVWQCRSVFSHRHRGKSPDREPLNDQMRDPSEFTDMTDQRELIDELAVTLSPKERTLLDLTLEGYSRKEIGEKMDMEIEAVKKMKQRLIAKMAQNIKK